MREVKHHVSVKHTRSGKLRVRIDTVERGEKNISEEVSLGGVQWKKNINKYRKYVPLIYAKFLKLHAHFDQEVVDNLVPLLGKKDSTTSTEQSLSIFEKDIRKFHTDCSDWLTPLGYTETYSNNHPTHKKEIHFIKDRIRVICIMEYSDKWCYVYADKNLLGIKTGRFPIGTSELGELHRLVKSAVSTLPIGEGSTPDTDNK